jgi:RNA polymerase sigma-70 factor (ECF subfamily)
MLVYRQRPHAEWTPLFWSILRRRIVDLQRRNTFRLRFLAPSHRHDAGPDIDWADPASDPASTHAVRAACSQVATALSALPRRQREAFSLRVLEELSVEDTARARGCSEGSVTTHLSRARATLRQELGDNPQGELR